MLSSFWSATAVVVVAVVLLGSSVEGRNPDPIRDIVNNCHVRNQVRCFINPCHFARCNLDGARCYADYCGGCWDRWFDRNDQEVTTQCRNRRRSGTRA